MHATSSSPEPEEPAVLASFYRRGERGTEKLINPLDLAQLISGNRWPRRRGSTGRGWQYGLHVTWSSKCLKIDTCLFSVFFIPEQSEHRHCALSADKEVQPHLRAKIQQRAMKPVWRMHYGAKESVDRPGKDLKIL